jgi:hypothetical protein
MWLLKKSSRKRNFISCACFIFLILSFAVSCGNGAAAPGADAAENSAKLSAAPLPDAGEAQGWNPAGQKEVFPGDRLFEHIDGGADIYLEYGFDVLTVQQYNKENKLVSLEIYRMSDPAAAFGIYSYNRHPSLAQVDIGGDGVIHPNGVFFWQDMYYVDLRQLGSAPISPEEFKALAQAVSQKIGAKAEKPEIMTLLPQENRLPNSEVFARGRLAINNQVYVAENDLFGLKRGEAAAIARYRIGQPEFSIILAIYKNEEAAQEAFSRFQRHFLGNEKRDETQFVASTMPGKHNAIAIIGRYVAVVANAASADTALAEMKIVSENLRQQIGVPGQA